MDKTFTEVKVYPTHDIKNLSIDIHFSEEYGMNIIIHIILMIISAVGNIAMLIMTAKQVRKSESWLDVLFMHLAIADLLVTFLAMPVEIVWSLTVIWKAGDAMCRIASFFRVFGLYLLSFIIICISIDRYDVLMRPCRKELGFYRRGKVTLICAWVFSVSCSLLQVPVFHVETHPSITYFTQCVIISNDFSHLYEQKYTLFVMTVMFWLPVSVILYIYTKIFMEIRMSKEGKPHCLLINPLSPEEMYTLKMARSITAIFIFFWTPYYVMNTKYWIEQLSILPTNAAPLMPRIQKFLLLFAHINFCANPIIYGLIKIREKDETNPQFHLLKLIDESLELPATRDSDFTAFLKAPSSLYKFLTSHKKCAVSKPERTATIENSTSLCLPIDDVCDDNYIWGNNIRFVNECDDNEPDDNEHENNKHADDKCDNDQQDYGECVDNEPDDDERDDDEGDDDKGDNDKRDNDEYDNDQRDNDECVDNERDDDEGDDDKRDNDEYDNDQWDNDECVDNECDDDEGDNDESDNDESDDD